MRQGAVGGQGVDVEARRERVIQRTEAGDCCCELLLLVRLCRQAGSCSAVVAGVVLSNCQQEFIGSSAIAYLRVERGNSIAVHGDGCVLSLVAIGDMFFSALGGTDTRALGVGGGFRTRSCSLLRVCRRHVEFCVKGWLYGRKLARSRGLIK